MSAMVTRSPSHFPIDSATPKSLPHLSCRSAPCCTPGQQPVPRGDRDRCGAGGDRGKGETVMVVSKARAGLLLTAAVCVSVVGLRGRRFELHREPVGRVGTAPGQKGGTLYVLNLGPHNGLDPQASYVGADLEFASRVYARSLVTYSVGRRRQAHPRPGDRHRPDVRRRQDVEVHPRRHGEVAGRPEGHLRRRQVRHLAHLRDRRDLQRADLHPQLPRRPERRRRLAGLQGPLQEHRPGRLRQGDHLRRARR